MQSAAAVGDSDTDLGACGMPLLLGGAHVRTLLHKLRRQADRQFLRQVQSLQGEFFFHFLAWKSACKGRQ